MCEWDASTDYPRRCGSTSATTKSGNVTTTRCATEANPVVIVVIEAPEVDPSRVESKGEGGVPASTTNEGRNVTVSPPVVPPPPPGLGTRDGTSDGASDVEGTPPCWLSSVMSTVGGVRLGAAVGASRVVGAIVTSGGTVGPAVDGVAVVVVVVFEAGIAATGAGDTVGTSRGTNDVAGDNVGASSQQMRKIPSTVGQHSPVRPNSSHSGLAEQLAAPPPPDDDAGLRVGLEVVDGRLAGALGAGVGMLSLTASKTKPYTSFDPEHENCKLAKFDLSVRLPLNIPKLPSTELSLLACSNRHGVSNAANQKYIQSSCLSTRQ